VIHLEVVLQPEPRSASSARDFLRGTFAGWQAAGDASLDTALLVVTELVTNAVRHSGSRVTLAVTLEEGRLLLEVTDEAPGRPTLRDPGWESTGGRGLLLVQAVSTRWGVRPADSGAEHQATAGAGKVVWAELAAPLLTAT
jgi:anti-sigma regulatory factor (Ser/Thr protein kinase)